MEREVVIQNVLIVAPSAYTLGGLATWLDYLLPGLAGRGREVTLGLVAGPRYHRPDRYLSVHPWSRTISIECGCSTSAGRVLAVRTAVARLSPSLVLTVNIPDAVRATALEREAGRDVRAIMTCHGIQEDLFRDMHALRRELDAVVCTNQLACQLATEVGQISAERVFHCAYGTQVPTELPNLPDNEVFTIGYSGRLEQPQKRIHDLITIAELLREHDRHFRFLVAGAGPEESRLVATIRKAGLGQHFELLGFVPSEQLHDRLYSVADALIVTSSWETGPLVIWESMALGIPVVSSRYTGSGRERLLCDEENCLLFDVADTSDAASKLIRLRDQQDLRKRLRKNAFRLVADHLSCEASVDRWDKTLTEVCALPALANEAAPSPRPSGRLDSWVGVKLATQIRQALRRLPPDSGPGGEWPHTLVGAQLSDAEFLRKAAQMDRSSYGGEFPC